MDGVPYIGLYSASTPDLYVATGFRKWGMTGSMVAALSLCDLIIKNRHPYALFSPQRFKISASAKALWEEGKHSVKGLSIEFLTLPVEKAAEVPRGHGGIVEFQKQKIGVYKAHDGTVYVVSTRCPHLGCQLEWNPDELTWDCPCHGSRFDYEGRRLEGPAMKNIDE